MFSQQYQSLLFHFQYHIHLLLQVLFMFLFKTLVVRNPFSVLVELLGQLLQFLTHLQHLLIIFRLHLFSTFVLTCTLIKTFFKRVLAFATNCLLHCITLCLEFLNKIIFLLHCLNSVHHFFRHF